MEAASLLEDQPCLVRQTMCLRKRKSDEGEIEDEETEDGDELDELDALPYGVDMVVWGVPQPAAPIWGLTEGASRRFNLLVYDARARAFQAMAKQVSSEFVGPHGSWPLPHWRCWRAGADYMDSEQNFICFLSYVASAPPPVGIKLTTYLRYVIHRSQTKTIPIIEARIRAPLEVSAEYGRPMYVRRRLNYSFCGGGIRCVQCWTRRGGYSFQWQGPWTPSSATWQHWPGRPEVLRSLAQQHWPAGASGNTCWPRPGEYVDWDSIEGP